LIQQISETLLPAPIEPKFIEYGKYHSDKESSIKDFAIAQCIQKTPDFNFSLLYGNNPPLRTYRNRCSLTL